MNWSVAALDAIVSQIYPALKAVTTEGIWDPYLWFTFSMHLISASKIEFSDRVDFN